MRFRTYVPFAFSTFPFPRPVILQGCHVSQLLRAAALGGNESKFLFSHSASA